MPKLKNQTVGFRSFLKTSTYSKLTFEYHHLQEFRRGGNLLNRPPHEADIAEQIQHSINGGGLYHGTAYGPRQLLWQQKRPERLWKDNGPDLYRRFSICVQFR